MARAQPWNGNAPQRVDLVITNQTMPYLTGETLALKLRDIRPDIPIMLCTGFSHTMTEAKARSLGMDAFLMKPLGLRQLSQCIQQALMSESDSHPLRTRRQKNDGGH